MAKSQLVSIRRIAGQLNDILQNDDSLPQWVHTKLATSLDRLSTAYNYLQSKIERMSTNGYRQNPYYIENGSEMCVFAWTSAIVLSPISKDDLLDEAEDAGFDRKLVEVVVNEMLEKGDIVLTSDGLLVDEDFA
jgi:hypothetical protein